MSDRITIGNAKRFLVSAYRFFKGGGETVGQIKAEKRAYACSHCPQNDRKNKKGLCPDCFKGVVFIFLRKRLQTSQDKKLTYCHCCGCDLRVKVHIPIEAIDNEGVDYPDHCWNKTEQDNGPLPH